MTNEAAEPGLRAWSAPCQQGAFRQLMRAFSFPGRVETLAGEEALTQTLATLVDGEVTLADPQNLVDALTRQRLQARLAGAGQAQFIVAEGRVPPAFEPRLGTLGSPETGATILVNVAAVGDGAVWRLAGPGIETATSFAVTGLDPAWMAARDEWNAGFPLGVDLIVLDRSRLVALPRTTRITAQGDHSWAM